MWHDSPKEGGGWWGGKPYNSIQLVDLQSSYPAKIEKRGRWRLVDCGCSNQNCSMQIKADFMLLLAEIGYYSIGSLQASKSHTRKDLHQFRNIFSRNFMERVIKF